MSLFKKQKRSQSYASYWLSDSGALPHGYTRLIDCPEVSACIAAIAAPVSSATLYLMTNDKKGDRRIRDALSRKMDIDPCRVLGTRQAFIKWILTTMLSDGDGNAFVLPVYRDSYLADNLVMPGACAVPNGESYAVTWKGRTFSDQDVLHFKLDIDPMTPYLGRGPRISADRLAESLANTESLKAHLSSPKYKPPLIVSVDADADLSGDGAKDAFRAEFLESEESGKPWIIPGGMISVSQVKPLSLSDLAVADTITLDKKAIASLFRVPAFMLGVGDFNLAAYNNFIRSTVVPICVGIEQELTNKLIYSPERYFQFNRRRLYAYDVKDLVGIYTSMQDRGDVCGDEVREAAMLDPAGLTEFKVLENYIPYDMSGSQKKLIQEAIEDAQS